MKSILKKIIIELGFFELFKIIPELKKQIFKYIFYSLIISILDLLSLSLIGIFIISLFTGIFDNVYTETLLTNFSFFTKLLIFSSLIMLIYFFKAILSYNLLKKIIEFCFNQQSIIRKKYLTFYFSDFDILKNQSFDQNLSSIIEYIRRITENYLVYSLRFISDSLVIVVIFLFLLIRDIKLTVLLLAVISLSFFLYINFYRKKIFDLGAKSSSYYKSLIDKTLFIFSAFKEIKIHSKENQFIKDFVDESKNYTDKVKKFSLLSNLPRYYAEFIFVVFILLISIFTFKFVGSNEIAYSIIGIYSAAAARLAPLVNNLTQSMSIIWNNRDAAIKVKEFLDYSKNNISENSFFDYSKSDPREKKNLIIRIKIENYNFSYGQKEIFKNVNLEINKDQITGIYGNSGSGKTTLINSIIGFLKPKKGNIYFLDNIGNKYQNNRQKFISFIPQEIRLMSETISKNVSLELDKEKINVVDVKKALETANALSFVNNLEKNINTVLTSNGENLSGGQKQRLVIARALYHNSKVLILDEPFSSLDEKSEEYLMKILNKIKKDKIIIIITHKKNISQYFDRIIMVDEKNKTIKNLNSINEY
jgi:ABC-type multidrug transport system fused ATPase/permease subunit